MIIIEKFATRSPCYKINLEQMRLLPHNSNADARYQEYYQRFADGDIYLYLHSLGCERESAEYQAQRWDVESNEDAIAHAVIDSNSGDVVQVLPWEMRAWHAGTTGNNMAIGIEMCESKAISYNREESWLFTVNDRATAERHCRTTYNAAVALFAQLCKMHKLNPATRVLSHKEAHAMGIGSDHGDPEHYWSGLGTGYTMDGFRADVAAAINQTEETSPVPNPTPKLEAGFVGFPDVKEDDWYADALAWAVERNIVLKSGKPFLPDKPLDKATFIVLLRRFWLAMQN